MRIYIIRPGKTKNNSISTLEADYLKMLSRDLKVELIDVKPAKVNDSNDQTQKLKAVEEEGESIKKMLKPKQFVIACDERGQQFTSIDLAGKIRELKNHSLSLVFVIGGSFGLDKSICDQANLKLSFSRFTFTHEMVRLILLEQLYRSTTIISGKTYHY